VTARGRLGNLVKYDVNRSPRSERRHTVSDLPAVSDPDAGRVEALTGTLAKKASVQGISFDGISRTERVDAAAGWIIDDLRGSR